MHLRLHRNWRQFAESCRSLNAKIVFPQTALFEIELRQLELYEKQVQAIEEATRLLSQYHPFELPADAKDLIAVTDLVVELGKTGVEVMVEPAQLADYQDAERRAAKHLPPAPPRATEGTSEKEQSDEMRDLVIWAIACRLAKAHDGAILLSRDKVHTSAAGALEAEACNLLRARDFDDAAGMLGAETPSGLLAKKYLRQVWPVLRNGGLPVQEAFSVRTIANVSFVQGAAGIQRMSFRFSALTTEDKLLYGSIEIESVEPLMLRVRLSDTKVEKRLARLKTDVFTVNLLSPVDEQPDDYEERLEALRSLSGVL